MKTRIRLSRSYGTVLYYPEYKTRFMPFWRRITDKEGTPLYSSRRKDDLVTLCQRVASGERLPRYKVPRGVVWRSK